MEGIKQKRLGCELLDLNNDALTLIIKCLAHGDVASLGSTCTKLRKLSEREDLWRYLLARDFGVKKDPDFDKDASSKQVYKQEKEFEKEIKEGYTQLYILSLNLYRGETEFVKCCLRRGADINNVKYYGRTGFVCACEQGYEEIVELFLIKGADIDERDDIGCTPLMCASSFGCKYMVEFLIAKGASINQTDNYGRTALMRASGRGHKGVVDVLVSSGADINIITKSGSTARSYAEKYEFNESLKLKFNKSIKFTNVF